MWPDFVKIKLDGVDVERLLRHPDLEFVGKFHEKTGEANENVLKAEYRTGTITIYNLFETCGNKRHVIFAGSIHKM